MTVTTRSCFWLSGEKIEPFCVAPFSLDSGDKCQKQVDRLEGKPLWEGFRESRRCSRDTYPVAYIAECTLVYED
jgi:hypothetical protein